MLLAKFWNTSEIPLNLTQYLTQNSCWHIIIFFIVGVNKINIIYSWQWRNIHQCHTIQFASKKKRGGQTKNITPETEKLSNIHDPQQKKKIEYITKSGSELFKRSVIIFSPDKVQGDKCQNFKVQTKFCQNTKSLGGSVLKLFKIEFHRLLIDFL